MTEGFTRYGLAEGVNLYVQPTKKFKTSVVYFYVHTPLSPETVTKNALLPMVLARASADFPTTSELYRHLDDLYGASLGVDVMRRGEVHSIIFRMEVPGEQHIPGEKGLLEKGIQTLAGIVTRPLLEKDGFKADYFEQEATNLKHTIESLINDKRRYAMVRCTEAMCEGEPFALYRLGRAEDLPHITAHNLYEYHQQVLSTAPVDIFIVGDLEPETTKTLVEKHLKLPAAGPHGRHMPKTEVKREGRHPHRKVEDQLDVNQGVLVIGMRTGTTMRDEEYFPMLVANAVLGGFPHSKLFQEVRERNSLAYFAYSALETVKGVGFMYAGVEFANMDKCRDIMLKQLQAVQSGDIDDEEFATTQRTLINDMLGAADSPGALADLAVDRVFSGRDLSIEDRIKAFEAVTKEAAASAAKKFSVDTVYFLTKKGGE
ncbi:MAG: EF-P 5-aminopentanol modification-associated protein YfmF [Mycobacterium leprae]